MMICANRNLIRLQSLIRKKVCLLRYQIITFWTRNYLLPPGLPNMQLVAPIKGDWVLTKCKRIFMNVQHNQQHISNTNRIYRTYSKSPNSVCLCLCL